MDNIREWVKAKGTGATMGKSLSDDQVARLTDGLNREDVPLATRMTLLVALIMLPGTPAETEWVTRVMSDATVLPLPLRWVITHQYPTPLAALAGRVIAGNDLSKSEADRAMAWVFGEDDDAIKAALLEGLRLKRETPTENLAAWGACQQRTTPLQTDEPMVLDLAHPYDGFSRTPWLAPFVASTLAACGVPVVLHGVPMGTPKNGINTHQILQQYGRHIPQSGTESVARLRATGWTYVAQSVVCPALWSLHALRVAMVKRPVLATVEKLMVPVRARRTYLAASYTHPPYQAKMTDLMARLPVHQWVVVRGQEGGVQLPIDRRCPWVTVPPTLDGFVSPEWVGVARDDRKLSLEDAQPEGVLTHDGHPWRALLRWQCAAWVHWIQPDGTALARVDDALRSHAAWDRWHRWGI